MAATPGDRDEAQQGQRPATADEAGVEPTPSDPLRRSRASGLWVAVVALGVVLVLLIVFISQNTQSVEIRFLGWSGSAPLAIAMLISAVAGLFLAAVAGTLRIVQLRRRVGKLRKGARTRQDASSSQGGTSQGEDHRTSAQGKPRS